METATWSSIGKIFFWWADNSDAARYNKGENFEHFVL